MHLASLHLFGVLTTLRTSFRHARAERKRTENVVVVARLADGTEGVGEGVPRSYVTGESPASARQVLAGADMSLLAADFASFREVVQAVARWRIPDDDAVVHNAARCAVELAVLDAFGRWARSPLDDAVRLLLPGERTAGAPAPVRYSFVIPLTGARRRALIALLTRVTGFNSIKIKVGADDDDDVAAVRAARRLVGPHVDIRIDANGAWTLPRARDVLERMRPFALSAVEEPLCPEEVEGLAELRRAGVPDVILDESLVTFADAERAVERGWCDVFDIRISKCGGVAPSLALVALADRVGADFMLGCQVGESAVLGAAGRRLATCVRGWRYLEGSYDRLLLSRNLAAPTMSFGLGGRARPLDGAGLGVRRVPWPTRGVDDWGERRFT